MSYTFSLLKTKADCTALIGQANIEKEDLDFRKTGLSRQSQSATTKAASIAIDLATVTAELQALETILATLPPGPTYDENVVKKRKAEHKKFLLEQSSLNNGPMGVVEKQYKMACIDQAIAETDAYIAALIVRRDELPS